VEERIKMKLMKEYNRPLKVLTWHVHGSYLYYLTQAPCEFYLPVKEGSREEGYGGRTSSFPWGENVFNVPAEKVKDLDFDVILFQSKKNFVTDQFEILSAEQRNLPRIYLEHDPPREVPTDTKHIVDDPEMLLVHVTHFNDLMWDNNRTPSIVIPHGVVTDENIRYSGKLDKGIVVINGLGKRGRRLGLDVFERVREEIPLDLVGMGSGELGGLGEIPVTELPGLITQYRFFFNPIRYTSLGLAICEAMMAGMPVIGLATTELSVIIENNVSGFIHTDVNTLVDKMKFLLDNRAEASRLSLGAKKYADENFGISRFASDWVNVFEIMAARNKDKIVVSSRLAGGER
jgi:glycosyltransferase involved in cell wall biosynthesis